VIVADVHVERIAVDESETDPPLVLDNAISIVPHIQEVKLRGDRSGAAEGDIRTPSKHHAREQGRRPVVPLRGT
jgi:hypothetical protein